jgi:hypothetical protein
MHVLTPFDFVEAFPEGHSVVFVGNAPSLRGAALSSWIESHDVIVRFNACMIEGFSDDVGSRTDILVTNPYPEGRPPMLNGGRAKMVLAIAPETRRGSKIAFAEWIGDHKVLFTYTPDLVGVPGVDHRAGLTTGTYAIQLLWRLLRPSRVGCAGFTMFSTGSAFHYWSNTIPRGIAGHEVGTEARTFIRVLNSINAQLQITEEIAWLAQKAGLPLNPRFAVIPLPGNQWRI